MGDMGLAALMQNAGFNSPHLDGVPAWCGAKQNHYLGESHPEGSDLFRHNSDQGFNSPAAHCFLTK